MKSAPEHSGQVPEEVETFCQEDLHPLARKGLQKYNAGEYYEAHEYLELAWRETDSPGRDLYQGILQVGVAYYQIQRENYRGALKMFNRARALLEPLPDVCQGMNVALLRRDAEKVEKTLREIGPDQISDFDFEMLPPIKLGKCK